MKRYQLAKVIIREARKRGLVWAITKKWYKEDTDGYYRSIKLFEVPPTMPTVPHKVEEIIFLFN